MQAIPLQPIPNQTFQTQLGNQACTISVVQYRYGLFLSLTVGGTLVVASVLCMNLVRLVRDAYLGFSGDLAFVDTAGSQDPDYTGLGTRYQLIWLQPSDLGS